VGEMEIANPEIKKLVDIAKEKGLETPHTRYEKQKRKCKFGKSGVCCVTCAEGPCRITEKSPYGICGLNADQIVARNLLRRVAAGTACYIHVCENTAKVLAYMNVKNDKLDEVCSILEIDPDPKKLSEIVLTDIYRSRWESSVIVQKVGFDKRLEVFRKLGIIPGGAKAEIVDALVKTSTNLNSNVVDLLLHVLKLGVINGYIALRMNTWMNDIMFGVPSIEEVECGVGIIDPGYVNIMMTGHQSALQMAIIEVANSEKMQKLARDAGAKGIRVVGATCVGQDLQSRWNSVKNTCFIGQCANNFGVEPLLASGLIDAVVSDFNCTFSGISNIAKSEKIKLIAIDDVALLERAELLRWSPEKAREIAEKAIELAIESFKVRKDRIGTKKKAIVGFSEVFIKENADKLLEYIVNGKIKGIVAIVGCSNLASGGHDVLVRDLTKELLSRDILIWTAGCASYSLQSLGFMSEEGLEYAGDGLKEVCSELKLPPVWDFGMCMSIARLEYAAELIAKTLNVDLPDLPVAVSAPQWLEEQALSDGAFALSCGFLLHVYPDPFISGSKLVTKILTEDLVNLTGGRLVVEKDATKAADIIEKHIEDKVKNLKVEK